MILNSALLYYSDLNGMIIGSLYLFRPEWEFRRCIQPIQSYSSPSFEALRQSPTLRLAQPSALAASRGGARGRERGVLHNYARNRRLFYVSPAAVRVRRLSS